MKFVERKKLVKPEQALQKHPKDSRLEYLYGGKLETQIRPMPTQVMKAPAHDLVTEIVDRYMEAGPLYF